MPDFIDLMNESMAKEGLSVRSLEKKIKDIFKKEAKVSKSLINLYQRRSNVPSYTAAYQLAIALDMDAEKALAALYEYRKQRNEEDELREYRKALSLVKKGR
ncbi:MAG: hypothetical protein ACOC78_01065 [Actinomycetota bacterium]